MKFLYILFISLISLSTFGQGKYSKLKVHLTPTHTIQQLAELDLEIDHGEWRKNQYFIHYFSAIEKAKIESAGFEVKVLIEDAKQYHLEQRSTEIELRGSDICDGALSYDYQRPENFQFGTMMGYFRYEEMLRELDEMRVRFPHIITERQPIGDIRTHDGNPLYWLRIGSNENSDIQKPEVLYTALHHAREPLSLSQLIYFMWFILENYETDAEIKYLLDYTNLYFIPCVNPDGYILNETENPNGGGFWRKNTRDNNEDGIINGEDGVDLNRNYGFKWGSEYNGSSSSPSSAVYRGTSAFSEPETQAVAQFCEAHDFRIAMNYHSFGNLLIYPWSYSDQPTEDASAFNAMTKAMTEENYFLAGTPSQTVGYIVNGDADDWMYGEQETKLKILALTPEVGTSFWPPMHQIETSCQSTLLQNLVTAHLPHAYARFKEESSIYIKENNNNLRVNIKNIGLQEGNFKVTVEPLSPNVLTVGSEVTLSLSSLESEVVDVAYEVANNAEEVEFVLQIDNLKGYVQRDTIRKIQKNYELLFEDNATTLSNWQLQGGTWNITNTDFFSAPSSFTDSPDGTYTPNALNVFSLGESINLEEVLELRLQYRAKWMLEPRYDNVQILVSFNGRTYIPICGAYSTLSKGATWSGEPVYNGFQEEWIFEDIDLTDDLKIAQNEYVNPTMSLMLVLDADEDTQHDGFYIDDIKIVVDKGSTTSISMLDEQENPLLIHPNPFSESINIKLNTYTADDILEVYNATGQQVLEQKINANNNLINTANWASGLYFCRLKQKGRTVGVQKLIKQ